MQQREFEHTIDYSEIKCLKDCPQKHYFEYVLDLEPNRPQLWSILGTAVHSALDAYYGNGDDCLLAYNTSFLAQYTEIKKDYALGEGEVDDLRELCLLGEGMLKHYLDYYNGDQSFRYLVSELTFVVPIPNTQGGFKGRIDGIIVDESGEYWIAEHKTASPFPPPAFFALDEQSLKYQWAVQQLITAGTILEVPQDVVLAGYWYNGLLKKVPKRPELVEKGKRLSKAKISSTSKVFAQTVLDHGFLLEDYGDILDGLESQGNLFFFRHYQTRTQTEMRNIAWRLEMEYQERFRENRPIIPKTPDRYCEKCAFYSPCLGTQRGTDVQDILTSQYHLRLHRSERGAAV